MWAQVCASTAQYTKIAPRGVFPPQKSQDWGGAGRVPCAFLKKPQLLSSSITDVQKNG